MLPDPDLTLDHQTDPAARRWPELVRAAAFAPGWRGALSCALFAALIFLPWLGAVGFWDPWEPHYGEVARQMLVRDDYLYPYWESAYFFSKPILLMWMSALAMNLVGIHGHALPAGAVPAGATPSGVSIYTEWAVRLPVALLAILACALVYLAVARIVSRRAGVIAAVALATMPFYALMARQAITDMPFVALMTAGMACFAVALWDEQAHRSAWAYAGYVFLGFATLAKGLLGVALPAATFLAWFVLTGDWGKLGRLRLVERVGRISLPLGPLVFLAVAAPWYLVLSLFRGVDDESQTFAYRFWIHDHFDRLASGVHTTTPGGSFAYFLEQGGYGTFPWVAALPGALAELTRVRVRERRPRESFLLLAGIWAVLTYVLMSFSATKFHHYIFPAVPGIAILCALFLDRLWEEGPERHFGALALGLVAFAVVGHSLWTEPRSLPNLYVYNYQRPYPEAELDALHPVHALGPLHYAFGPRSMLAAITLGGGLALLLAGLRRWRRGLVLALAGIASASAIYLSWFHWRELSPNWSQRDIFWTYLSQRATPNEPIAAYDMNWRGETFYSRNLVKQLEAPELIRAFAAQPGRKWIIVERSRLQGLRSTLGQREAIEIADRSDNKFYLLSVGGVGR